MLVAFAAALVGFSLGLHFFSDYDSLRVADKSFGSRFVKMVFAFRAFMWCLGAPITSSFEALLTTALSEAFSDSSYFNESLAYSERLLLVPFAVSRVRLLFHKFVYVVVSFVRAGANKKTRFKNQNVIFVLYLTLLLPVFLFSLLVSTALNVATVPFLGFAFFLVGFLKPQRAWSRLTQVIPEISDSRSDGFLYHTLLPSLKKALSEKYLVFVSILQSSAGSGIVSRRQFLPFEE